MPALTRRRSPDARKECWQIFYGAVRVGTIAKRVGIPRDQAPWGWSCGFLSGQASRRMHWRRGGDAGAGQGRVREGLGGVSLEADRGRLPRVARPTGWTERKYA